MRRRRRSRRGLEEYRTLMKSAGPEGPKWRSGGSRQALGWQVGARWFRSGRCGTASGRPLGNAPGAPFGEHLVCTLTIFGLFWGVFWDPDAGSRISEK